MALSTPEASASLNLGRATWVVTFDGRVLGSAVTVDTGFRSSARWTYPRDHVLRLVPGTHPPRVVNASRAFMGWRGCGPPPARPLVLVSMPNFRDPQRWRPFRPDTSGRQVMFSRFRAAVDSVLVCPGDTGKPEVWEYRASDLVFDKSYKDARGRGLLALRLDPAANTCVGASGAEWSAHWFFAGTDTLYLGSELEVVDAGDYDADGYSEVLFWHRGHAEDGYTLFYDQFRKRVDYWWTYH